MTEPYPMRSEEPETVRCFCVLVHEHPTRGLILDRCNAHTTGPDDPFCDECIDRHVGSKWEVSNVLALRAQGVEVS